MRINMFGVRLDREGRSRDPAVRRRELRRAAVAGLVLAVVISAFWGYSWSHDRPLRGNGLASAQAQVIGMDFQRRSADKVVVRFPTQDGRSVDARIPVSGTYAAGDTVAARYLPSDPSRVRTFDGWRSSSKPYVLVLPVLFLGFAAYALRAAAAIGRRAAGDAPTGP